RVRCRQTDQERNPSILAGSRVSPDRSAASRPPNELIISSTASSQSPRATVIAAGMTRTAGPEEERQAMGRGHEARETRLHQYLKLNPTQRGKPQCWGI